MPGSNWRKAIRQGFKDGHLAAHLGALLDGSWTARSDRSIPQALAGSARYVCAAHFWGVVARYRERENGCLFCDIPTTGEIVNCRQPCERFDIHIMGHRRKRIDKNDERIQRTLADHGTNLQVTTKRALLNATTLILG